MQIDADNFSHKMTDHYGYPAESQISMNSCDTDQYVVLFRFAERKDSSSAQVESEKEIRTNGNGGPR